MRKERMVLGAALLVALAACAPAADLPPASTATSRAAATVTTASVTLTPARTPTPSPTAPAGTSAPPEAGLPPAQAAVVALAAADLAERTGVAAHALELVLIAADDLPAGDLGCRGPGTPSARQTGLVTGWVLRLQAGATVYEYHAHAGQIAYCGEIPNP